MPDSHNGNGEQRSGLTKGKKIGWTGRRKHETPKRIGDIKAGGVLDKGTWSSLIGLFWVGIGGFLG